MKSYGSSKRYLSAFTYNGLLYNHHCNYDSQSDPALTEVSDTILIELLLPRSTVKSLDYAKIQNTEQKH